MSNNMQRLGKTMADRMKLTTYAMMQISLDLGVVNGNMSITSDALRSEIPEGDYMVNLMLTAEERTGFGGKIEPHSHMVSSLGEETEKDEGHLGHSHPMPGAYRGLQPGDRVLLAWCGNEPVVIAIVVSS